MSTILVTGGTGFIGSSLAIALRQKGHDVRILRREHSDLRAIGNIDVKHYLGDVRDRESLRKAISGCSVVFHTAAVISHWRKERELMFETNISGTRNVVEACEELGIQKLVYTSSVSAVGFRSDGQLADETTEFNWDPYDIGYRISKYRAEQEVWNGFKRGLPAVILNPSTVIGPRDIHFHGGQLIRDVFRKKIFYYTKGGMNIAYIDDVVSGHLAALDRGQIGERYILAGENLTYQQVFTTTAEVVGGIRPFIRLPIPGVRFIAAAAEAVSTFTGRRPWVSRELVAGMEVCNWFSSDKARHELEYMTTPFRQAVGQTFDWYRKNKFL